MKVVHISYKDDQEGAAIAVDRICRALIKSGIDSTILVQKKVGDKPYSHSSEKNKLQKIFSFIRVGLDLLINNLLVKDKSVYFTFPFVGSDISKHPLVVEADVIHLHWINRGFLSLASINELLKLKKPVVWTLHDSWAFTGGCHMTGQCEKYKAKCKNCPLAPFLDLTSHFQEKKRKLYEGSRISFVTPSTWMVERASSSYALRNKTVTAIPNCVDTSIFKQLDSVNSRKIFNLPEDKSIVLFNITNDVRKGVEYLHQVIANLSQSNSNILFVGFGTSDIHKTVFSDLPITTVGRINDNYSMASLYNACDVLISPALEEPFGQTYIEAMACGTPCVAFDHSGPKDIIEHGKDGYLSKFLNLDSLIDGVNFCLENKETLGCAAIEKVNSKFSFEKVSRQHINHYASLLEN